MDATERGIVCRTFRSTVNPMLEYAQYEDNSIQLSIRSRGDSFASDFFLMNLLGQGESGFEVITDDFYFLRTSTNKEYKLPRIIFDKLARKFEDDPNTTIEWNTITPLLTVRRNWTTMPDELTDSRTGIPIPIPRPTNPEHWMHCPPLSVERKATNCNIYDTHRFVSSEQSATTTSFPRPQCSVPLSRYSIPSTISTPMSTSSQLVKRMDNEPIGVAFEAVTSVRTVKTVGQSPLVARNPKLSYDNETVEQRLRRLEQQSIELRALVDHLSWRLDDLSEKYEKINVNDKSNSENTIAQIDHFDLFHGDYRFDERKYSLTKKSNFKTWRLNLQMDLDARGLLEVIKTDGTSKRSFYTEKEVELRRKRVYDIIFQHLGEDYHFLIEKTRCPVELLQLIETEREFGDNVKAEVLLDRIEHVTWDFGKETAEQFNTRFDSLISQYRLNWKANELSDDNLCRIYLKAVEPHLPELQSFLIILDAQELSLTFQKLKKLVCLIVDKQLLLGQDYTAVPGSGRSDNHSSPLLDHGGGLIAEAAQPQQELLAARGRGRKQCTRCRKTHVGVCSLLELNLWRCNCCKQYTTHRRADCPFLPTNQGKTAKVNPNGIGPKAKQRCG